MTDLLKKPHFGEDDLARHLLDIESLGEKEIRFLLSVARAFEPHVSEGKSIPLLQNKTVANLFFENSTRTRVSFEVATRKLTGSILNFSSSTSSVKKGETLLDTAKTVVANHPHCLVVRHVSAGSSFLLSQKINLPVINAGDGFHEHPTQALLDAYTIENKLGEIKGKRVVIIGDIAHSRVARSNIYCLKKLGASVAVCGPPSLLPPSPESLGVDFAYRPEELLKEADVVMALRIQFERQNKMQIPSVGEYRRFWGLDLERSSLLKKEAIILHPGPVNRGVELDPQVADGPRSVILDQVANGVLIRMAVLSHYCNPQGLKGWLKKEGHDV